MSCVARHGHIYLALAQEKEIRASCKVGDLVELKCPSNEEAQKLVSKCNQDGDSEIKGVESMNGSHDSVYLRVSKGIRIPDGQPFIK